MRLKLYFELISLILLKIMLCGLLICFLVLFSPIFLLINKKSFYYCTNELYKAL